ncbi:MAG: hypothetical protein H7Y38_07765 [Armatimonadetes bacterium]|nr:hypothetical protein [Armatimonadota bacterium]
MKITSAFVLCFLFAAPTFAQAPPTFKPEGRPTAALQTGTPTPDIAVGVTFERDRIKRTPQLLPKTALSESRWDLLYIITEKAGRKTVYFDWDDNNIYLAWESPAPEPVRFDLDGASDGFLRGADNLQVQVETPVTLDPDAFSTAVSVTAELWDGAKNPNLPVRTPAPLPPSAIQAVAGRTVSGTYVVMVAIAKTELVGLPRIAGREIGLRVESGAPAVAPTGATILSNRPFVRLRLADRVDAKEGNVRVSLKLLGGKNVVAGDAVQAELQAKNEGATPVLLTRLFVRGSQASQPFVDAAALNSGVSLAPGKTIKLPLRSMISDTMPTGAHVLAGGAEWIPDTGATNNVPVSVAALASFNRVEPFYTRLSQPKSPVLTSNERGIGGTQTVVVTVGSRAIDAARAQVVLTLPLGWSLDGGDGVNRVVSLQGKGDERTLRFRMQIPAATAPGQYVIEARTAIDDATYTAAATITVAPAPPPKQK